MTRRDVADACLLAALIGFGVVVGLWIADDDGPPPPDCSYIHTRQVQGDDGITRPEPHADIDYRCTGAMP